MISQPTAPKRGPIEEEQPSGLTAAKLHALAAARRGRLAATRARRSSLVVPAPYRDAADFLRDIAALAGARPGGIADLARFCDVSVSTAAKWCRGAKVPSQPNVDRIAVWWRTHRDSIPVRPLPPPQLPAAGRQARARPPSLPVERLDPALLTRIDRAASLRRLTSLDQLTAEATSK